MNSYENSTHMHVYYARSTAILTIHKTTLKGCENSFILLYVQLKNANFSATTIHGGYKFDRN